MQYHKRNGTLSSFTADTDITNDDDETVVNRSEYIQSPPRNQCLNQPLVYNTPPTFTDIEDTASAPDSPDFGNKHHIQRRLFSPAFQQPETTSSPAFRNIFETSPPKAASSIEEESPFGKKVRSNVGRYINDEDELNLVEPYFFSAVSTQEPAFAFPSLASSFTKPAAIGEKKPTGASSAMASSERLAG